MSRGIQRALRATRAKVLREIEVNAESGGKFARGLSGEGYAGGYLQALSDVELALRGVTPSGSRYWTGVEPEGQIP